MPSANSCFFRVFDPFQTRILNGVNGIKLPKRFFPDQKICRKLGNQGRESRGRPQAPMAWPGGPASPRLVGSLGLPYPSSFAYKFPKIPKKSRDPRKYFSAAASFCLRKIPSGDRSGALPEGGFGHGGLLINTIASLTMRE